jgi:hypothetical protein
MTATRGRHTILPLLIIWTQELKRKRGGRATQKVGNKEDPKL